MAKTQDINAMMKDMMATFPVDTKSIENMFKSQSALTERMSTVAIEAAQKSTELSAKWMQDLLAKLSNVAKSHAEPAEYAKSMSDFVQTSAEAASQHMAAFAEIAKKAQTESVELMLAAGKDMSEDVTSAARKAAADVTAATKKATAAAR